MIPLRKFLRGPRRSEIETKRGHESIGAVLKREITTASASEIVAISDRESVPAPNLSAGPALFRALATKVRPAGFSFDLRRSLLRLSHLSHRRVTLGL